MGWWASAAFRMSTATGVRFAPIFRAPAIVADVVVQKICTSITVLVDVPFRRAGFNMEALFTVLEDGTLHPDVHPSGSMLIHSIPLYFASFDGEAYYSPRPAFTSEEALRQFYAGTPFGANLRSAFAQGYRIEGRVQLVPENVPVWIADLTFPNLTKEEQK